MCTVHSLYIFSKICSAIHADYELASHSQIEKLHRNCSQWFRQPEMQPPEAYSVLDLRLNVEQLDKRCTHTQTIEKEEINKKKLEL